MTFSPEQIDLAKLRSIIDRFRLITGPPVALHLGDPARQQILLGTTPCAACAFVNGFPAGTRACARSRAGAFTITRDSGQPVAFVCHLGFGCSACVVPGTRNCWITIGPFVSESAPESLEFSVREGLKAVAFPDALSGPLPFTLKDIPVRPPQAMAEAAAWIAESIAPLIPPVADTDLSASTERHESVAVHSEPVTFPTRRARAGRPKENSREVPHTGLDFPRLPISRAVPVLWLAGGYRARAEEAWLRRVREHTRLAGRARPDWNILLETVSDILEGCDRLEAQTAAAWEALAALREKATSVPAVPPDEIACTELFRKIRWSAASRALFRTLCTRWLEEIRNANPDLDTTASAAGMSSAALSRYLRQRLGLNYSGCRSALRAEAAREELEVSDKPVRMVAEAAGLSDPANLHRLFRRHGLPAPGLYRWLMQERK